MDSFIQKQKQLKNGFNTEQCLRMFGVSDSGYYAWRGRKLDVSGKQAEKEAERNAIKEKMRQIVIARNGCIPGKRTFRVELFRRFGLTVNVKRISSIMKEMNLAASRPKKDAYKHQATHDHICAAPDNKVCREFFVGPRKVILTDITYLYYGPNRAVFYLCVFRDAFTRENLGWLSQNRMDVSLVKGAYDEMIRKHGTELDRNSSVYIHSDQGSQYLATDFTEILTDDGFIQSVSARGNSQDNAPMESFFGRLKTDILDLIALCRTLKDSQKLIDGYLCAYNQEHYQYNLAGLTPEEFYGYATTGVYPLDSYFGVPASAMMTAGDLRKIRRTYSDEENEKRRRSEAEKRKEKERINPEGIIRRDRKMLERLICQWEESYEAAGKQVEHLKKILESTEKALQFIGSAAAEILEALCEPKAWRNYEELSYVFEMNELF